MISPATLTYMDMNLPHDSVLSNRLTLYVREISVAEVKCQAAGISIIK